MTLMLWPARFRLALRRIVWPASLVLASAVCFAGPYADLQKRLEGVKSPDEVVRLVSSVPQVANHPSIKDELNRVGGDDDKTDGADDLRSLVAMGAMAESSGATPVDQAMAQKVKESKLYTDRGFDNKRNWLSEAIERLKNIRLNDNSNDQGFGGKSSPPDWLGSVFMGLIWVLLIGAVLAVLYFAVRHLDWKRSLTRKAKALLEEDEPARSLDEWLELSDQHAAAGRYREAVRALYLSCLLKFDESSVARFDRGETNWEHLARINASPRLPAGLNFTEPTQRFDRIWYGYQSKGMPDVEEFRGWYRHISDLLEPLKAAA